MQRIRPKASDDLGYDLPTLAYGARHSFATTALHNGVDSIVVAGLMGRRGATMIARTYSHLDRKPDFFREQGKKAIQSE